MKRMMFLLCTISICFYSSCIQYNWESREGRMVKADAAARYACEEVNEGSEPYIPGGQDAINAMCNNFSAAASKAEGDAYDNGNRSVPLANQINPNIRVPRNLLLEFNPYEADGDMHNDAIDLIVREKLAGVDILDKLMNRDRQTIDKFLKLSPKFQDDNVRKDAIDAFIAMEVPAELKDKLIKITYAKDYLEGISYLNMPADSKALVTEVYATCNDYYTNEADFTVVAGYLNDKITSLFNKGKNVTAEDQKLARMFTVLKHSYYYWHGTK